MQSVLISCICFYQKIFKNKIPTCRYLPTCSEYSIVAIKEWGSIRGSLLGLWRILRCHPLAKSRVDMVPTRKRKE